MILCLVMSTCVYYFNCEKMYGNYLFLSMEQDFLFTIEILFSVAKTLVNPLFLIFIPDKIGNDDDFNDVLANLINLLNNEPMVILIIDLSNYSMFSVYFNI